MIDGHVALTGHVPIITAHAVGSDSIVHLYPRDMEVFE